MGLWEQEEYVSEKQDTHIFVANPKQKARKSNNENQAALCGRCDCRPLAGADRALHGMGL
jgi:hypothetical protein